MVNGNMCSGQGNCFEGKCHCAIDRSGDNCSNSLCFQDDDCLDIQFCSILQEFSWGIAPPPPPPVDPFESMLVLLPRLGPRLWKFVIIPEYSNREFSTEVVTAVGCHREGPHWLQTACMQCVS